MEKRDLTYRIIGCAMSTHKKLKRGCAAYVYCRALAIELNRELIDFDRDVWLPIHYDQFRIAARHCDFYCSEGILIEVNVKRELDRDDVLYAINTVEQLNVREALLLNFGAENLQFKHVFNNKLRPNSDFEDVSPELVGEKDAASFELRPYLPDWLANKVLHDHTRRSLTEV